MKTVEEAWSIIENINDEAHNNAWDTWIEAEEAEHEEAYEEAEELRDQASAEQAEYFRESWYDLSKEDQEVILYWLEHDNDFREQFATYFGEEEFINEFERQI